jgi:hypothetical protein
VPIDKLEAATSEVMVQIPKERIPLLNEIYQVARQEERFECNELRRSTFSVSGSRPLNCHSARDDCLCCRVGEDHPKPSGKGTVSANAPSKHCLSNPRRFRCWTNARPTDVRPEPVTE